MRWLQRIKTEKVQTGIIFLLSCGAMAMVLLPLFAIAFYNFKSVDDFSYAQHAEGIWEQTHSVLAVLIGQIPYTREYYLTWQGTFFSEWFTTSVMGIFSKNAYYVSTWLTLGGFVLAQGFLLMTVFGKVLGADRKRAGIVTICCILMQVLLTPAPCEGFYWFCGSMLYTFIHALALVLCTLWIRLYVSTDRKRWQEAFLGAGILLLSVAVAGSNYITALTILILYVLCTAYFFLRGHGKRLFVLACNILYLAAFLVNVLAPGNTARQNAAGVAPMGAVESILMSLREAAMYIATWTIFPCIVMGLLLLPMFLYIVKQKQFRYPFPALVSLLSFCVFAAQFTPTLYALGITGAGRVQNLYRFNYFLLLYGNELYWTGWLYRRHLCGRTASREDNKQPGEKTSWLLPAWMAGSVILMLALYVWGGSTVTAVSAIKSLRNAEARQYHAEFQERLALLEDKAVEHVELKPFTAMPYLLHFGDIVENPEDWVNKSMAEYYGKKSVVLKKP